jgi:hypothetical protein
MRLDGLYPAAAAAVGDADYGYDINFISRSQNDS